MTFQSLLENLTEADHQKQLFIELEKLYPVFPDLIWAFHIPNEGAGPLRGMAGRMKALGSKPGVPDICYPIPRLGFHGLWIELKSMKPSASLTANQKLWLNALEHAGHCVKACRGMDQALITIVEYETGIILPAEFIKKINIWYRHPFQKNRSKILRFINEQAKVTKASQPVI
jgi:hypothetical protein